jgi:prolyl oligopeptidase
MGDKLWLLTDYNAPNNRLVEIDPDNPSPEKWKDVLAERENVLTGFSIAAGELFSRCTSSTAKMFASTETIRRFWPATAVSAPFAFLRL